MSADPQIPLPLPAGGARVIVLEAPAGRARRERLEAWTRDAARQGQAWLVTCDADEGGLWAGADAWMEALLPALEREAPDLVTRHDAELTNVLPALLSRIRPRYVTLTDAARGEEAVRNYAADRAARIPHGLVDLLAEWHARSGGGRWAVACDRFGSRGPSVRDFFRHLVRRRGEALGLTLLVAVEPGEGEAAAAEFEAFAPVRRVRLALETGPAGRPDPAEARRRAGELEELASLDDLAARATGARIARLWTEAGETERALHWHAVLVGMLTHMGFYEDALRHAVPLVEAGLEAFDRPRAVYPRAILVNKLSTVFVATGRPDEALRVVRREGLERLSDPLDRTQALYQAAMLHARHLPERDLERGEAYLNEALAELDRAVLSPEERHFHGVFLLNGLAYVRMRMGHPQEAATLTERNFQRLEENLAPTRHRLHRSVLLYNAGQVYAQTGQPERAIEQFTLAMEMDPHYSEYHNDRGNLYLKLGRLEEAEADYRRAIEMSPPYPEVWFNLGQALARMGRGEEAERAYARAVDLDPARFEAWVNLGRMRAAAGRPREALAAYDAAVALDDRNPFVLSNRAAVHAGLGGLEEALADLERAVELAPGHPVLERNRTLAWEAASRRRAAEPAAQAALS